ncbi:hypothetical protein [Amycolatopsis sp. Hca4]|uniref:hypothetical protein n=1 Tax=Amycolatopsis sp. Hca4 TaxID=2742131 RepID=UPI0015926DEF|nr:hypothetical protein [Amycolatopsis sp. Hca4]QKV74134.1 hypothetical protein HUT10_10415 [Amycolatopsis sp. Hca4]
MAIENACAINGWSAISSAATNSQLAGLLAGFIFTSVTILFNRRSISSTRTLILFAPTFVVLGFDSYLFSMLTGGTTDPLCDRLWSQSMPASGMLAVGATGVVSGIAWLLADHAKSRMLRHKQSEPSKESGISNLHRISRFMIYGVSVAVMLLLSVNCLDYLRILKIFDPKAIWLVSSSPVAVLVCTLTLGWARTLRRGAKTKGASLSSAATTKALSGAAFGTLTYAVAGPVFAGALTIPNWPTRTPGIVVAIAMSLGIIIPALLIITLALAAPPVRQKPDNVNRDSNQYSITINSSVADKLDILTEVNMGAGLGYQVEPVNARKDRYPDASREAAPWRVDIRLASAAAAVLGMLMWAVSWINRRPSEPRTTHRKRKSPGR